MLCEGGVGSTNPDIALLGIIVSFAVQAFVSLVLSLFAWLLHRQEQLDDTLAEKKRLVHRLLADISDIQTVNGIALLVAALMQVKTLDLYHFHIVYDTVNLT
ncbi:hypothetical protein C8A03DRAFT_39560, partial [Achaetomium macrosporum]